jgi:hypothetical protein
VNRKENFESLDLDTILAKVMELPVTKWNYKTDPKTKHIGPMAQDFYKQFGLGGDNKTITPIDPTGISLAAIQGLYKKLKEDEQKIQDLQSVIDKQQAQQAQIDALTERLNELEKKVNGTNAANH